MNQTISINHPTSSPFHLHSLFLFLIFITACSVFKEKSFLQADSLQKHNAKRETKVEENMHVQSVRVYNHQDSSENRSLTEIFPDGPFTYSVNGGFSGTARLVAINNRLEAGSKAKDSATIDSRKNTLLNVRESDRSLTQSRLKEKTTDARNYIPLYLGGVILIFAAIFFFRLKLND